MGDGLQLGIKAIRAPVTGGRTAGRSGCPARSCCSPTARARAGEDPIEVAAEAKKYKIPIYAIALGTPTGTMTPARRHARCRCRPTRRRCSRSRGTTGGRFFTAPTARDLEAVYANLGRGLATRNEKQEVTAAFAGGALALLLAGLVTSLLRNGRLP